jgi:23S rRNA pseudouridine1911/1915/1917 synthase
MSVVKRGGKEARTLYHVEQKFGEACALVECQLESGRTHQIRVHMESIGHPLIGDPLYGPQKNGVSSALKKSGYDDETVAKVIEFPRQALHAGHIAFIHPGTEEPMEFDAAPPLDMSNILKLLNK